MAFKAIITQKRLETSPPSKNDRSKKGNKSSRRSFIRSFKRKRSGVKCDALMTNIKKVYVDPNNEKDERLLFASDAKPPPSPSGGNSGFPRYISVSERQQRAIAVPEAASPGNISNVSTISDPSFGYGVPHINRMVMLRPLLPPLISQSEGGGWNDSGAEEEDDIGLSWNPSRRMSGTINNPNNISTKQQGMLRRPSSSILTRSSYFTRIANKAFDEIIMGGGNKKNGTKVDKNEVHSGLLTIHLRLSAYLGAAACQPSSREQTNKIFDEIDTKQSGTLNREEFTQVMMVLCSHILSKVACQWSLTVMTVPFIAQGLIMSWVWLSNMICHYWVMVVAKLIGNLWYDDVLLVDSSNTKVLWIVDKLHLKMVWSLMEMIVHKWEYMSKIVESTPDRILYAIPLTVTWLIFGSILVPYCLLNYDTFFRSFTYGGGGDHALSARQNGILFSGKVFNEHHIHVNPM